MRASTPCVTLLRIVVEAATPWSIGAGRGDGVRDVLLARDAVGLPMIPAPALAGVIRGLAAAEDEALARTLFGYAEGDQGQVSRVEFSHGHVHDSHDRPVEGLELKVDATDALLAGLLAPAPALRQRVRINHRGAAADTGLFDRTVLPAGHRFSFELRWWSATPDDSQTHRLLHWLASPALRLGAQTRSGLGAVELVRVHGRQFDLRRVDELTAYSRINPGLGAMEGLPLFAPSAQPIDPATEPAEIVIALHPEAGFRFGQGVRSLNTQNSRDNKLADDLPLSESVVHWVGGRGVLDPLPRALVSASAVKGALAHRVAFHHRRLSGQWATAGSADAGDPRADDAVRALFGHIADTQHGTPVGQAGALHFTDVYLATDSFRAARQMHNSIDRFTGGVRDGLLFSHENVYAKQPTQPLFTLTIGIDERRALRNGVQPIHWKAFDLALADLCEGRLALGADGATGLGHFRGEMTRRGGTPSATEQPTQDVPA